MFFVAVFVVTGARSPFGVDFACFGKGNFGEKGADEFVDKDGEQGDVQDDISIQFCAWCTRDDIRHTQRNARLGKKGDTEILDDILVAFRHSRTCASTRALTDRAEDDIHNAYQDEDRVLENFKVKVCAADDEEDGEQGCCPSIHTFHKMFGEVTDIAENRAEHHTGKKGGEGNMQVANRFDRDTSDGNRQQ